MPSHAVAAAARRLSHALRCRFRPGFFLRSSFQSISSRLGGEAARSKVLCHRFKCGFNSIRCSINEALPAATLTGFSFFDGRSKRDFFEDRQWTNILVAANVSVYFANSLSNDKLFYWGAKINDLISIGQSWRLVTSSFLHTGPSHLLTNCSSLYSIGPAIEEICGPRRYLVVYFTSAITGSAMSFWLCNAPSVGASGAIFGLLGCYAMFALRHRGVIKGAEDDFRHITEVILLNMIEGLQSENIDNWAHVGGFIGGAAVSWFVGPAWKLESVSHDGRKELVDKAPIFSLVRRYST